VAYVKDEVFRITKIVVPLTRPPMMWGIPRNAFVVETMGVAVLFVIVQRFSVFLAWIPLHSIMYILTVRDPYFLEVLKIKLGKTFTTRNNPFWGGNSYSPDSGLKAQANAARKKRR
jgi:type IV secretion system protein VirB3